MDPLLTEEAIHILFEQSSDGLFLTDPDLNILKVNERGASITGFDRETLCTMNVKELFPLATLTSDPPNQSKIPHKDFILRERLILTASGEKKSIMVKSTKLNNQFTLTFVQDITQVKTAQQHIAESEAKYLHLMENAPLAISIHSEGIIAYANPAAAKLMGVPNADELVGTSVLSYVHPDFRAMIAQRLKVVTEQRKAVPPIEEIFVRPDGTSLDVEVIGLPSSINGKPASQVIVNDISTRKRAERELNRQNALLQAIADASLFLLSSEEQEGIRKAFQMIGETTKVDQVYLFEHHHHLDVSLLTVSRLYNYDIKSKELDISTPGMQSLSYEQQGFMRWYEELGKGKCVQGPIRTFPLAEYEFLNKQKIQSLIVVPVLVHGHFWGFMGLDDCHNERTWTASEEATLKTLAACVGTAIIRNRIEKQMGEITQRLQTTNQELEQFAYIISHNLRSPIHNIKSLLNLYHLFKDNKSFQEEVVEKLDKSVVKLEETIKDLLEIVSARKEINTHFKMVYLESFFDELIASIESLLIDNNAKISTDFSLVPAVFYPQTHLQSICQNLITNAIKYRSPIRPPHIKISTSKQDEYVVLSVADNGIGIDLNKYQDQLFGLYKRFHDHVEGKGLGLYIVKTQVEALGGKIEVDSELGKGTTFRVFILNKS